MKYNLLIIGGGSAAFAAALKASDIGQPLFHFLSRRNTVTLRLPVVSFCLS